MEEPSFCEFIMEQVPSTSKLPQLASSLVVEPGTGSSGSLPHTATLRLQVKGHTGAEQVLGAVREILDVDADSFVLKLYQVSHAHYSF